MLIASLGLADLMWSLVVIFFIVTYWMILFFVIVDVFRRDASGASKTVWLILLLFLPIFGMIMYLISHGNEMNQRGAGSGRAS